MAGTEVNLYGVGDVDLTALMNTVDIQRVTFQGLSLTNYDNTALPAIAAGSLVEVGGTLFKFSIEEAITAWAGVAAGVAYIKLVPAGVTPDTVTAEFTDTAPTWSDAKQGWYGTVASANHRYVASLDKVDAATYSNKNVYNGRYGERPMRSRSRVTKNDAQIIATVTATLIEFDDEVYDNLSEYDDAVNYRFTASGTGYYLATASTLSASVAWGDAEYWETRLRKNGVAYAYGSRATGAAVTCARSSILSVMVYLEAGEYIDVRVYHNQGGNVALTPNELYNYFSVHRLS